MCDTIAAISSCTAAHVSLFGKNSDRYRNEAHAVEYFKRADHGEGAQLRCTYLTIPQVCHTHAVLLCRPFWIWGAEMGANEHGVVIGNEGVRARQAPATDPALTGMDLLRLALERSSNARQAVDVVTELLERHGQGGNCGHLRDSYYDNSFMIVDASDAFVLETVGKAWLLERVRDLRAISNVYSVGRNPDAVSPDLRRMVRDNGWSTESAPHFAQAIADPESQHIGDSAARWARSTALLKSQLGALDVASMMHILRDHGPHEGRTDWHPEHEHRRTLCMHAGAEDVRTQTTGSLVSEIRAAGAVHWVTGTAAPCISVFKPVLMNAPLPEHGPRPTDRFDARTLWWRHERLHRAAVLGDFAGFLADIEPERDAMEAQFRRQIAGVLDASAAADRSQIVAECWRLALAAEDRWYNRLSREAPARATPFVTGWRAMNQLAGLETERRASD